MEPTASTPGPPKQSSLLRRDSASRKRQANPHPVISMNAVSLVAEASRANPLTRNEAQSHASNGQNPSMPSSVASSGLNFTQFMQ